ncbi:MAG: alanine:cation symporter family protein [Bacteroidales bacterium]|nr:alanine:cation symporter family protein [Bacteroidales bacterium]MCF8327613.1 alanine:cation symporter family protein [Bacteroidales bacterium]
MEEVLHVINGVIEGYNKYVGGYLLLLILVPTGVFFAFRFKFLHVRYFRHALGVITGKYDRKEDKGDINHFRALTTALSATVGTGNVVGVALAIYYGGPGAIFWMWVTGFFGMMTKFVECTLSQKFRGVHEDGTIAGGPMYYMEFGLKEKLGKFAKVLAMIFGVATILCSLGTGNMAQSNSMSDILKESYNLQTWISGAIIASLVLLVIIGGIKRIANVTSKLVPFMAIIYFLSAFIILGTFYYAIPEAFSMIVTDAFTGTAAKGGFLGSAFIITLRYGVSRGLFSNEAGQGSAAIAHSAAKTTYPVREGLVASLGPFIDTILVCTITALVIIVTGAWMSGEEGVAMTVTGFTDGLSPLNLGHLAKHIISGSLLMFAFSTMISWSYYGSQATAYVFGWKHVTLYRVIFGVFVFLGALGKIGIVWNFVDMVITFMTIPNLIALLLLTPIVAKEVKSYFREYPKFDR